MAHMLVKWCWVVVVGVGVLPCLDIVANDLQLLFDVRPIEDNILKFNNKGQMRGDNLQGMHIGDGAR